MPDLIRISESGRVLKAMENLIRAVLRELEFGTELEQYKGFEDDLLNSYEFSRNKLIGIIEEFDENMSLNLAIQFKDVINATRLSVSLSNFQELHQLYDSYEGSEKEKVLEGAMQWVLDNALSGRRRGEFVVQKWRIFDIFEERYFGSLSKFLDGKYPELKRVLDMRNGEFSEAEHIFGVLNAI